VTTFFLVRHAVTSHTGERLTGWLEGVHLTEEGEEQARIAAEGLAHVTFDAVYSSPIDRTIETARAIAKPNKTPVKVRRGLGEVQYGKWTNRPLKTLMKTKLWEQILRVPSSVRFPDGETLREVQARAVSEIEQIALEHPKGKVCCVSHGDVIKLIAAHYLGVHIDLFQRIVIAPASVSVISLSSYGPRILALNNCPLTPPA
jgi:probable phosphomutase (TIGR03848 family)